MTLDGSNPVSPGDKTTIPDGMRVYISQGGSLTITGQIHNQGAIYGTVTISGTGGNLENGTDGADNTGVYLKSCVLKDGGSINKRGTIERGEVVKGVLYNFGTVKDGKVSGGTYYNDADGISAVVEITGSTVYNM